MKMPKSKSLTSEIPTASMADIAFLLIVFFMVTTTFAATKGLDFKLPTDDEDTAIEKAPDTDEAVYIHVTAAGVEVDCKAMELPEILPYLQPKLERNPNKPVILHTELDARYEQMVQVYDELAKASQVWGEGKDITNISVPTSTEIERYTQLFGYNPFAESCK